MSSHCLQCFHTKNFLIICVLLFCVCLPHWAVHSIKDSSFSFHHCGPSARCCARHTRDTPKDSFCFMLTSCIKMVLPASSRILRFKYALKIKFGILSLIWKFRDRVDFLVSIDLTSQPRPVGTRQECLFYCAGFFLVHFPYVVISSQSLIHCPARLGRKCHRRVTGDRCLGPPELGWPQAWAEALPSSWHHQFGNNFKDPQDPMETST